MATFVAAAFVASCTPGPPPVVPPTDPVPEAGSPLLPARLDCARWRYDGVTKGPLPEEWDAGDYRFSSERDPGSNRSPHRQCGQLGAAVDLAWGVETGMPETVIAVLDSGVRWRDEDSAKDLASTAYLNRGELPPPIGVAVGKNVYDHNGDGRFSVDDYANDPRVSDRNENGVLDPEDLILTPEFNDGVDSDGNGYVDDISGWDFLHNDNNPLDDVDYGHGTGEARDSAAAHNGFGAFGVCGDCSHLPVRVSDSFIVEGGRFAAGVLFALDSGASVVQEALGAITNPPQSQQAIDAAYASGVPIVASMADEQSQHANLPSAVNHTIAVNSVTESASFLGSIGPILTGRRDTLAINGCTNTGAITWVSVPSDGCSSEATGNAAGMVGLIVSAARRNGLKLSANEIAQVLQAGADDVDFATPNFFDPANDVTDDFGQRRFPSVRGWDATYGFGRINAYESTKAVATANIPPEADITSPRWFSMEPTSGRLPVVGRVAAPRAGSYSYRVEWTTGLQTPPYPAVDDWRVVTEHSGLTSPVDGVLGELDLAQIAAALPGGGTGVPATAEGQPDPDRFTVRVRVVTTDDVGRVGTMNRQFSVHDDPTLASATVVSGAGMSSPRFVDVTGDGTSEMVLGTDDGYVHVLDADGKDLPGFPVRTPDAAYWHTGSLAAQEFGITRPGEAIPVGAPAVSDLDGDGVKEIVVTDLGGNVSWWHADGSFSARSATNIDFSRAENTDERNRVKRGIAGSASLGDLDGDGTLEIVVAAMDRHVYAWHHDGKPVDGFPVLVVDPNMVSAVDPDSHRVTFRSPEGTGIGGELIATPAIGDLNGDGRPEIVVGAQEQYNETVAVFPAFGLPGTSGNTRLYAILPDGTQSTGIYSRGPSPTQPDAQAYLRGWPAPLPMLMTNVLPTIGDGVSTQAAIADINSDGTPEVIASSVSGQVMVLNGSGRSALGIFDLLIAPNWLNAVPPGSNSIDTGIIVSAFGGPSVGRIGSVDTLDVVATTSGLGRALDTLFTNSQDGDPQLTVWSGADGSIRNGFPRVSSDIAFFVTPGVMDIDGDGRNEAVAGNGLHLLQAASADGSAPNGWPKLTGGWVVGTPTIGDWDGDGKAEVAVIRRDGQLLVWRTPTDAANPGDWTSYGANERNDGRVHPLRGGPQG